MTDHKFLINALECCSEPWFRLNDDCRLSLAKASLNYYKISFLVLCMHYDMYMTDNGLSLHDRTRYLLYIFLPCHRLLILVSIKSWALTVNGDLLFTRSTKCPWNMKDVNVLTLCMGLLYFVKELYELVFLIRWSKCGCLNVCG